MYTQLISNSLQNCALGYVRPRCSFLIRGELEMSACCLQGIRNELAPKKHNMSPEGRKMNRLKISASERYVSNLKTFGRLAGLGAGGR